MSTHKSLAEALVAAQSEMPKVERDGKNPHFNSNFTTLGHLIAKVRPVLNLHGIAVVQMPSHDERGHSTLTTRLIHTSGESMEFTMPLLLPKNDPQGQGSALTYARRYALAAALGISDQEDDDGNAGSAPVEQKPGDAEVDELVAAIKDADLDFDRLCLVIGSVGGDAPAKKTVGAVRASVAALTVEQAGNLAKVVEGAKGS